MDGDRICNVNWPGSSVAMAVAAGDVVGSHAIAITKGGNNKDRVWK